MQGQEARIIFISTVLTRPASLPPALPAHPESGIDGGMLGSLTSRIQPDGALVGFWRNPKRFNVAITRAKALLVVVGHPLVLMEVFSCCGALFWCLKTWPCPTSGYGIQGAVRQVP